MLMINYYIERNMCSLIKLLHYFKVIIYISNTILGEISSNLIFDTGQMLALFGIKIIFLILRLKTYFQGHLKKFIE